jgi:hypothetical protein
MRTQPLLVELKRLLRLPKAVLMNAYAQNRPFQYAQPLARMNIMLKVQAILHDGSVALEFMTDDASEAEEMRQQLLAVEGVANARILDQPGWLEA